MHEEKESTKAWIHANLQNQPAKPINVKQKIKTNMIKTLNNNPKKSKLNLFFFLFLSKTRKEILG